MPNACLSPGKDLYTNSSCIEEAVRLGCLKRWKPRKIMARETSDNGSHSLGDGDQEMIEALHCKGNGRSVVCIRGGEDPL